MLMLFFPRADYATPQTADQAPDNQGSSSKTTSIIIGVVVGGVAAIASTSFLSLPRFDHSTNYTHHSISAAN
jgi:hypothetical protein